MKKFLSHILPFTKKITSPINGILEVTYNNGTKVLDTTNANYSYGSLQRVLKHALKNIELKGVKNILLLGLGGGSVIETLLKEFKYQGIITAIDLDPVIIEIAGSEFEIKANNKLKIICEDAGNFMKSNSEKFDLVIVDLFIDNKIPAQFFDLEFWKNIRNSLTQNGIIIFNTIEETSQEMEILKNYFKQENFELKQLNKVEDTNTVFIWTKN